MSSIQVLARSLRPLSKLSFSRALVTRSWQVYRTTPSHPRRSFTSIPSRRNQAPTAPPTSEFTGPSQPQEPRLSLTFTCTAGGCGHRSSHQFTKRAYENGLVIIQCPSCKNRHLIADHIGWFKEIEGMGGYKDVEGFMKAKGEDVNRGRLSAEDGLIEYTIDEK